MYSVDDFYKLLLATYGVDRKNVTPKRALIMPQPSGAGGDLQKSVFMYTFLNK